MTLRQYLILMSLCAVLSWVAWFFVVSNTNPNESGTVVFAFFYFSLFLAVVGTISVLGFLIRKAIIKNDEVVFRHVKKTFRQSIVIATLLIITLALLSQELLAWWNGLLLLILFFVLEGVIFTNRKYRNVDYVK